MCIRDRCTVLGFSVSGISMAQSVPTDKEAAAKAAKAAKVKFRWAFRKAASMSVPAAIAPWLSIRQQSFSLITHATFSAKSTVPALP